LCATYLAACTPDLKPESVELISKVFDPDNGIRTRALACADPRQVLWENADTMHERYRSSAVALGAAALERALERSGVGRGDLAALIACTCTGYLCPGLTSYLVEALGLARTLRVFDLVGMGCAASLPGLDLATQLARAMPGRAVVLRRTAFATVRDAREELMKRLLPELPGKLKYEALMIANAMAIAAREFEAGHENDVRELNGLKQLLLGDASNFQDSEGLLEQALKTCRKKLCADIRAGHVDPSQERHADLVRYLKVTVRDKVAISNPKLLSAAGAK
jgi:hypothetical protein